MATSNHVGVREAKARFSALLRDARRGREWIITERGAPIAKLAPLGAEEIPLREWLRRMVARGVIGPERVKPNVIQGRGAWRGARSGPRAPLSTEQYGIEPGLAQRYLREDRDREPAWEAASAVLQARAGWTSDAFRRTGGRDGRQKAKKPAARFRGRRRKERAEGAVKAIDE